MRFLLIHSPLVGPSTWRPVADVLRERGHLVHLPDLRGDLHSREAFAAAARPETPVDIVVGHSGAGVFLPAVVADGHGALVFVDAGLPPAEGPAAASEDFLDHLRRRSCDGIVPRWSTWWGPEIMARLIPSARLRAEVETDMPEVPLAFYERPVPVPAGWRDRRCGYVLLSEPYRPCAEEAADLSWRVVERPGMHLDLVTFPGEIADALVAAAS